MSADLEARVRRAAPAAEQAPDRVMATRDTVVARAAARWQQDAPSTARWRPGRLVLTAIALGLVLVVAIALVVARHPASQPQPVTPPGPRPIPRAFTALAPRPFPTTRDWASLNGWRVNFRAVVRKFLPRTLAQPHQLSQCITDARQLGATEFRSSGWGHPGKSNLNEYVLRYDDATAATRAFADVRNQFAGCSRRHGLAFTITDGTNLVGWPADEAFGGQAPQGRRYRDVITHEWVPNRYQVGVVRDANVVIVIESYNGWPDGGDTVLRLALLRAIPSELQRCPMEDPLLCPGRDARPPGGRTTGT